MSFRKNTPDSIIAIASKKPDKKENLPDKMLLRTPTVKAYLAASAKILTKSFFRFYLYT